MLDGGPLLGVEGALEQVIRNATVLTCNARGEVLRDAEVVVREGRIADVRAARKKTATGRNVFDAQGGVVIPGLVHGHLHACQTLCRNRADGLELLDWLKKRIWPYEAAHDAESMRASADLTFLELIQSGATAALDMGSVHHYDEVFASARDAGFRLTGGKAMMDAGQGVPRGLLETTASSLAESERLRRRWHTAASGRLRYAYAPRFVLSCSTELLRAVGRAAGVDGVRIHTHASENATECRVVKKLTGRDNIEHFSDLGLLGPHTTLAHCVWPTKREQRVLAKTRTRVCHCPSANLKLASGIAPIPELLEQGISVGLGADGAPCNNNLDMWQEMRLAALVHLPRRGPKAVSAQTVLDMATLGGARALGLEKEIGSLEIGKKADLAVVELGSAHHSPVGDDEVATLVYSGRSNDVRDVMIDGAWVMRAGDVLTMDMSRVIASAERHAKRLADVIRER